MGCSPCGGGRTNRKDENPKELLDQIDAYEFTQSIYVVAKLRVPDLLKEGPLSIDEIANRVRAHPRSLFRVMRYLASRGIFTQGEDENESGVKFGATATSELLRSDRRNSYWPWAILDGQEFYHAAGDLLHTVLTGETAFNHVYGRPFFDYMRTHKETSEIFDLAMNMHVTNWEKLLNLFDFGRFNTIVDVGGGRGALLASVLRANPKMNGILFDLPHVVSEAKTYLESNGVADRCKIVPGDALKDPIPSGGDLYVMGALLHIFQDPEAQTILTNCRKSIANNEDATLLIVEGVVPEGAAPSPSKSRDMTMLYLVGGLEKTEKEWQTLLTNADFELIEIKKTEFPFDLIVAQPR